MKITRKRITAASSARSDLRIDMWYGDEFNKDEYGADATFYPNEGVYRGNIYDKSGKAVGDYSCSDSVAIAKELGIIFNSTSLRDKRPIKADAADVGETEQEELYYDVCINDDPTGNPVYDYDEAIRIAKEYADDPDFAEDEITVRIAHYTVSDGPVFQKKTGVIIL